MRSLQPRRLILPLASGLAALWGTATAGYLGHLPAWEAAGEDPDEHAGAAVAAGDVDGDGLPDLVVGSPGFEDGEEGEGRVRLWLGGAAGPAWELQSGQPEAGLGAAALVADFDGDGLDDLVVGAPGWDEGAGEVGRVLLFAGGPSGLAAEPSWSAAGAVAGDSLGAALCAPGDVDGDGFDDLLVGAPGTASPGVVAGAVYLFRGGAEGLLDEPPAVARAADPGGWFGAAVAGAGDLDGDGRTDVLVGEPGHSADGPLRGRAILILGAAGGLSDGFAWSATGAADGDRLGASLVGLADGDGLLALAVGAPGASDAAGAVLVWSGLPAPGAAPAITLWGGRAGDQLGHALAAADLDGDLWPDLAVGAPGWDGDGADRGAVLVYPGGAAGLGPSPAVTVPGGVGDRWLGATLTARGLDGLLVGVPYASLGAGQEEGRALLLPGLAASEDLDGDGFCDQDATCDDSVSAGDCDDSDPRRHPGATEVCDGVDNDCDGLSGADDVDGDGDGVAVCAGDCDDAEESVWPGAPEECDGLDNDCDGVVDEGLSQPWWPDADGDGYGADDEDPVESCVPPSGGWVSNDDDCADGDPDRNPASAELICNQRDDDCAAATADIPDEDHDGYTPCPSCEGLGTPLQCGDCDDAQRRTHPGHVDTCEDGVDQDCDGEDPECNPTSPCDEPDLICDEPACQCSSGRGGPGLAALLLVGLWGLGGRRRRRTVVAPLATVVLLVAVPASAGEADLDTQLLRPSFAPWGWTSSPGALPGDAGTVRTGVVLQYERSPMVVLEQGVPLGPLVGHRFSATVGGWVAPVNGLGVGASIPLYLQDSPWPGFTVPEVALGDLKFEVAWRFLRVQSFHLALHGDFHLPTSTRGALVGERKPRAAPGLIAQVATGPLAAVIDVQAHFREKVHTGYDMDLGMELSLLAGVRLWAAPERVAVSAELQLRSAVARFWHGAAENPVDLRITARLLPARALQIDVGAGIGLNGGYGAAPLRVLAAVTFRHVPPHGESIDGAAEAEVEQDTGPDLESLVEDVPAPVSEPERPMPPAVEAPEPEGPLVELQDSQIRILKRIEFEAGQDRLREDSLPVLQEVKRILDEHPEIAHLLIEGHTSLEGSVDYNCKLSDARASAVFRYLVGAGVSADRLSYRGLGEALPHLDAQGEMVLPEDRRVEFRIVSRLDGWADEVPDWDAEAPPVPWRMPELEQLHPVPVESLERIRAVHAARERRAARSSAESAPAPPVAPVIEQEAPQRWTWEERDAWEGDDDDSAAAQEEIEDPEGAAE